MSASDVEVLREDFDEVLCKLGVCPNACARTATERKHIVLDPELLTCCIAAGDPLGPVLDGFDHLFLLRIWDGEDLAAACKEHNDVDVLGLLSSAAYICLDRK